MSSFDQKAKSWDDDPAKTERAKSFAAELVKHIPLGTNSKGLEFGCGTGLLSFQLKDKFNSIVLADSSAGMIEVLTGKIKAEGLNHFKPLLTDQLANDYHEEKVDVIYTLMTLHHVSDLDELFQQFEAVLKPNGYLAIGDLVTEDGSFHGLNSGFDGHRGFDKNELENRLLQNGFETIWYSTFFEIHKKEKSYPLFILIVRKTK